MTLVKFLSNWSWRVQMSDYYAFHEHDIIIFVPVDILNVTKIYKSYIVPYAIFLYSLPQSWTRVLTYLVYVQLLSILVHDRATHIPSFLKRRLAITLALMVVYSRPGAYKSFCSVPKRSVSWYLWGAIILAWNKWKILFDKITIELVLCFWHSHSIYRTRIDIM